MKRKDGEKKRVLDGKQRFQAQTTLQRWAEQNANAEASFAEISQMLSTATGIAIEYLSTAVVKNMFTAIGLDAKDFTKASSSPVSVLGRRLEAAEAELKELREQLAELTEVVTGKQWTRTPQSNRQIAET